MNLLILYATFLALLAPREALQIGLLVPDHSYSSVISAAQKAIDEANHSGEYGDHPFKLIVRTTEGLWGAGSKESVSLVYEDNVRAIVGSLDGRNAHLAEQVAAKSHLVYLETRATDPTLSQAYVPWFFRIVPNDDQQSRALLDIIKKKGEGGLAILSQDQYDTGYAVRSFTKYAKRANGIAPLILDLDSADLHTADPIDQLKGSKTAHLVIPYYSEFSLELIDLIKKEIPQMLIYGTLNFCAGLKERDFKREELQGMMLIHSYAPGKNMDSETDLHAMYAYEGVLLILKAIQEAGSDRDAIKEHLFTIAYTNGLSGSLSFDDMGNRSGSLRFCKINKGRLEPTE
ncbi:MAG: ABC transporter substrate-binding protein [Bacteroidota bacterium]